MAVSLTQVFNEVTAILNAARASYGTIDDNLFFSNEINDAALAADKQVIATILDTAGHRHRRTFVVKVTVTDGQAITETFEGGVLIAGSPGKPVSPGALARLKQNPNNNTLVTGYYCIQGNIISFTGSPCQIDVVQYTPSGSLQSPDEYLMAVVAGTLAQVFPKQGTNVGAAGHFAGLFQTCLQLIRQGATTMPAITPFMGGGAG